MADTFAVVATAATTAAALAARSLFAPRAPHKRMEIHAMIDELFVCTRTRSAKIRLYESRPFASPKEPRQGFIN